MLAPSGTASCDGCGTLILTYAECQAAASSGAAALGIGGLGAEEYWADGPPGCHIQDNSGFQYNMVMDGGGHGGHTPVCHAASSLTSGGAENSAEISSTIGGGASWGVVFSGLAALWARP